MVSKSKKDFGNIAGKNGKFGGLDEDSEEFKIASAWILSRSKKQSPEQKLKTEILAIKFDMEEYLSETNPSEILSVGYFLRELINLIGVKNKNFAEYINLSSSNLSSTISSKRPVGMSLAIKLEKIFEIPASLWLNIQNKNALLEEDTKNYNQYSLENLLEAVS